MRENPEFKIGNRNPNAKPGNSLMTGLAAWLGAVQTWGETSNSLPVGRTFLSATGASGGQDCPLHRVVTQL